MSPFFLHILLFQYIIIKVVILDKKILEKYLDQKLNITIFEELDSTNNYLKKVGSKGEKENHLVIALSQTGGRGRMVQESTFLYFYTLSFLPKNHYF